jgi:uncharacterized protein (TIGR02646 family)
MRPVVKGEHPKENGIDSVFKEYGDARNHLINAIGDYCSYCENQITNPATEHTQPKVLNPQLNLSWDNFLLACINCNSIKGHQVINKNKYYWPDEHNTHLLFEFHPHGSVTVKNNLPATIDKNKAMSTIELTGLDRFGSTTSKADRRWIKRGEAWRDAEQWRISYLAGNNSQETINLLVTHSKRQGFWSVWMKVFENEEIVKQHLINAFLGTFSECQTADIDRNI